MESTLAGTFSGEETADRIIIFMKKNRVNELYGGRNLCTRKRGRTERDEIFPRIPARMQVKCTFIASCEKFAIYSS